MNNRMALTTSAQGPSYRYPAHDDPPDDQHRRMMKDMKKSDLSETFTNDHKDRVHEFERFGNEIEPKGTGHSHVFTIFGHHHSLTEQVVATTIDANDDLRQKQMEEINEQTSTYFFNHVDRENNECHVVDEQN
jgi:hypothetical protein